MERKGTLMRDSNKRVAARRAVLDAQAERRRVRQEREDQLMGLAVAVNVALSYWLAAGAMRRWVLRLAGWLGYRLPEMPAGTAWQLVTVVRLAPGLPFWMQSYLLGVVRAAYLTPSTLIPAFYISATIAGGDALARGRGRTALLAFAALGFIAALVHLLRKRRAKRAAG